jgi:hypothetical protein
VAYANDLGDQERLHEKELFRLFLKKLADLDKGDACYPVVDAS